METSTGLMKLPTSPVVGSDLLNIPGHPHQISSYHHMGKFGQHPLNTSGQQMTAQHSPTPGAIQCPSPPISRAQIHSEGPHQQHLMTSPTSTNAPQPRSSTPNTAGNNVASERQLQQPHQFVDAGKDISHQDSGLGLGFGKEVSPPTRNGHRSRQNSKGSPNSDSDYGSNSTSGTPNKSEYIF